MGYYTSIPLLLACLFLGACSAEKENSQGEGFLNQVDQVSTDLQDDSHMLAFFDQKPQPLSPAFTVLPQGSVRPKGWIKEMMQSDLEKGMVGALDDLYPGIKKDDLYRTARRGGLEDVPEMGDLVLTGEEWEQSIMWWNAETAGNWWDGFVRHAFLLGEEKAKRQAQQIVDNLIASQDKDGYLGIYKPNLRYQHNGSNGELWAQTTAFRTLLGYYEITGDKRALEAVKKGINLTMREYGPEGRHPFRLENAFGGVTHGLMITDVCEWLYRLTGDITYQEYATFLYKAFSTYNINRAFNDLRYPFLVERDSLFTGHGVHTYEHFRTMAQAYYATGYPELKTAFDNAIYKLDQVLLPSGAGHGNEWLLGIPADPTYTTTEYCTMLELRNSLASLYQKTGDLRFADQAEKLTYNGMLGFRNAEGTALTYGKGDNCFILDGHHHGEGEATADVRYKYSPTHSDPAVCCVPNYSRNLPYFLDQMWLKAEEGLVAAMYGPCMLQTEVNGAFVIIRQQTRYPYEDAVVFTLELDAPTEFSLYFRKPAWSKTLTFSPDYETTTIPNGLICITKTWEPGESFTLTFEQNIQHQVAQNEEVYFQRGPLVYALEIPHKEQTIKEYEQGKFRDYYALPIDNAHQSIQLDLNTLTYRFEAGTSPQLVLNEDLRLIPLGKTVLRRLTFPLKP